MDTDLSFKRTYRAKAATPHCFSLDRVFYLLMSIVICIHSGTVKDSDSNGLRQWIRAILPVAAQHPIM